MSFRSRHETPGSIYVGFLGRKVLRLQVQVDDDVGVLAWAAASDRPILQNLALVHVVLRSSRKYHSTSRSACVEPFA